MTYEEFFLSLTGRDPYPYQSRLAQDPNWPSIVAIPTGLGKTAAVILAWLWRRHVAPASTPRRLVYTLPMRVLVRQTYDLARTWASRASALLGSPTTAHVLLGGETDQSWESRPEDPAILVGTQDMLLSRALNRGYAASRFRWPMAFGLLNSDCLWVFDEIQLMGSGLGTTAQLQALRRRCGVASPVQSCWMSATLREEWLGTVDLVPELDVCGRLELNEQDRAHPDVLRRIQASKPLTLLPPDQAPVDAILREHRPGTLTLVVVNTVRRAVELHDALLKRNTGAELALVHSRFRPPDRARPLQKLLENPPSAGTIVVSTQVVEAGVDVSACTLLTDLAPWSSMVQRLGRCNRYGLDPSARVFCFDMDTSKKGAALPYEVQELERSREILCTIANAAPDMLPGPDSPALGGVVLRKRDLLDLFDNTADLAGADIDISRFIRDSTDHDLHVFWRALPPDGPSPKEPTPTSDELCPVSVSDFRAFKASKVWSWDHLERCWSPTREFRPGQVLLLSASEGGYREDLGWTGKAAHTPTITRTPERNAHAPEADEDDPYVNRTWQSLASHTNAVVSELKGILAALHGLPEPLVQELLHAARWHDAGKAHPVFQDAIRGSEPSAPQGLLAKSALERIYYSRRGFRHELASALLLLQTGGGDLAAYLAAAHHGKVRLSIRSLPHEEADLNHPEKRFARGIFQGDVLRPGELGAGEQVPKIALDLACMELGESPSGPSWASRTLRLRDDPLIGPFRLAFLEALLRSADWRGSAREVCDD